MNLKDKLHSASPRVITFLLMHDSCNYFPNCTRIHVITYTNSIESNLIPWPEEAMDKESEYIFLKSIT